MGAARSGVATAAMAVNLVRFDSLVRTLRARCPWDREQSHTTLRRHLLEEAYETLETLDSRVGLDDSDDTARLDSDLCEELGDLLYQVFFHARLASERNAFTVSDVAKGVRCKLTARHPHVFGAVEARDADTVRANWDEIKLAEKGRESVMDGIPATLPALLRSVKVMKRAAAAGLVEVPTQHRAVFGDVDSALADFKADSSEHCLGELLLATVELGRRLSIDPEDALRRATSRAEAAYRDLETRDRLT